MMKGHQVAGLSLVQEKPVSDICSGSKYFGAYRPQYSGRFYGRSAPPKGLSHLRRSNALQDHGEGITPRLTYLFAFPKIKEVGLLNQRASPAVCVRKMLYRHISRGRTCLKLPRILVERRKYLESGQVRHMGSNRIVNFDKRFLYQLHHAKGCYRFGHRCNAEKTATAHFLRSSHIGPTKGRII